MLQASKRVGCSVIAAVPFGRQATQTRLQQIHWYKYRCSSHMIAGTDMIATSLPQIKNQYNFEMLQNRNGK
jgi:hypothetical protein